MDHVVYVDTIAKELEALIEGKKTMIVRGAAGRKVPHGKVNVGDTLYFIRNNAEGTLQAKAEVIDVHYSDKLNAEESMSLLNNNQNKLQLTEKQYKRWGGKRYLTLITIKDIQKIDTLAFDRNRFSNSMDDWLIIGDISEAIK